MLYSVVWGHIYYVCNNTVDKCTKVIEENISYLAPAWKDLQYNKNTIHMSDNHAVDL